MINSKEQQCSKNNVFNRYFCKPVIQLLQRFKTSVFFSPGISTSLHTEVLSAGAGGYSDRRVRVVIPACAVTRIRRQWPAPENRSVGFRPASVEVRVPLE